MDTDGSTKHPGGTGARRGYFSKASYPESCRRDARAPGASLRFSGSCRRDARAPGASLRFSGSCRRDARAPSAWPTRSAAAFAALRLCAFALFLFSVCVAVGGQETHPPGPHTHPEAQRIKNPVPSDEASIEAGRKLYARHCASCHGPGGKGDGAMALAGGTPSNLVDEAWDHGSTDGEIFVVIRDGVSSDMESYKDRITEKDIWHVVNYLRSLGPKR